MKFDEEIFNNALSSLETLQSMRDVLMLFRHGFECNASTAARFSNLVEEVGELAVTERFRVDTTDKPSESIESLRLDAVGDVLFALLGYCSAADIKISEAVRHAWLNILMKGTR